MFRLEIATDNAAFDVYPEQELAAVLFRLVTHLREGETRIQDGEDTGTLRDSNGNTVGQWQYTPEG